MFSIAILAAVLAAPAPSVPGVHGPRRTADTTPTYRFASHERGLAKARIRFRCAFDRPRLHRCRARYTQRLTLGRHVLRVQAADPAGRRSRVRKLVVRIVPPSPWRIRRIDVGGHPFSLGS